MADNSKKEGFEWKEGQTLDDASFSPLGDIRGHGLAKINKAIAKDPAVRKQERERYLAQQQSQPYKGGQSDPNSPHHPSEIESKDVIVEDNASDLSGEFEDSEIKRLTDKGNLNKGISRFGNNK